MHPHRKVDVCPCCERTHCAQTLAVGTSRISSAPHISRMHLRRRVKVRQRYARGYPGGRECSGSGIIQQLPISTSSCETFGAVHTARVEHGVAASLLLSG
jgi:hypothetical protein